MEYKKSDLFELTEDINSPMFTRRLSVGYQVSGYWIKEFLIYVG